MIKKLHKIPNRVFFKSVFLIIILINLKYFFLPIQIMYTGLAVPFLTNNNFYSQVQKTKQSISEIKDFYDEGKTGFTSDTIQADVFDLQDSIKAFYITQYAIAPSILKNDTNHKYVIGAFSKDIKIPKDFTIEKKIAHNLYILKKENK